MIQRATRKRLKIRNLTRNPDLSVRLSIFQVFRSCSNQNTRSAFLFYIFRIATDNKVKIGNWRSISDAKQFIFFTQFSARIQFSKYDLPILSFFVFRKVFRSCSNQNTRSTFLYSKCDSQKDTKPVKKRRENRSWVQWAMLARPTIFFQLLLGGQFFLS